MFVCSPQVVFITITKFTKLMYVSTPDGMGGEREIFLILGKYLPWGVSRISCSQR